MGHGSVAERVTSEVAGNEEEETMCRLETGQSVYMASRDRLKLVLITVLFDFLVAVC